MNKPRKHAEAIKAWADGAQIQQRYPDEDFWSDCDVSDSSTPLFEATYIEFRVKPKVLRYRLALVSDFAGNYWLDIARSADDEGAFIRFTSFVKWLGDWQEVEV